MKNLFYTSHLLYIYTVYQEKSFTRAAEKLYISQPALSQVIKKVETEIGHPIFERFGKEVRVTQIGQKIVNSINEILRIQTKLDAEIDDIVKLKKGTITIGSTTFIASYVLPGILRRFKTKYPSIEIKMIVDHSNALEEKLESEQIDIIINNATAFIDWYQYVPLFKERVLLGVPSELPINNELSDYQLPHHLLKSNSVSYDSLPKISVSAFKKENFILLKKGNKLRQLSRQIFEEGHILMGECMEFDSLHTAVSYAEACFGICFLTDTSLRYSNICDKLCIYQPDTDFSELTLYVIYKKNRYLSNAFQELVKFLQGSIKRFS